MCLSAALRQPGVRHCVNRSSIRTEFEFAPGHSDMDLNVPVHLPVLTQNFEVEHFGDLFETRQRDQARTLRVAGHLVLQSVSQRLQSLVDFVNICLRSIRASVSVRVLTEQSDHAITKCCSRPPVSFCFFWQRSHPWLALQKPPPHRISARWNQVH